MQAILILNSGSPAAWAPPSTATRLEEDHEPVYRDINAAHSPSHPTSPAVQAILHTAPTFPTDDIDIFACGNTLGNLFHVASSQDRTFRFNAEMVGKTVFFVRKENSPTDALKSVKGYGHTFPEAYTRWEEDVKGSVSHQRIISYEFGGSVCVVRSESDGFYEDLVREGEKATEHDDEENTSNDTRIISTSETEPGSVTDTFAPSTTTLNTPEMSKVAENESLVIIPAGRRIPQHAVFDLKTRSKFREINMTDILPRLWMNQTPNFIVAYHDRGLFEDIRKKDMTARIRVWEEQHAEVIAKFHALLKRVIEVVQKVGEGVGVEVRRVGTGAVEVRELVDVKWRALEGEVREKWRNGEIDEYAEKADVEVS